ncbi:anaerobic ribonucleoside-triphosphate reductase activating protein [Candidatus Bipolaricaulota bacterium]|nr:anaerobic ribonucleoside-triphosphate reductase activating protein [Candidatus Bipolaricaulota bacterium]
MKFAHLLPMTLIDYPDHIAALAYVAACNFRCPFCHNSELVLPEETSKLHLIPENDIFVTLHERQRFIDALVITGGEPTLQPGLGQFITRAKHLGLLVKLDTNGSQPEILEALFRAHLLDYVAMDVKGPPARYDELAGVHVDINAIQDSIRLIIHNAPDYEFRTTIAPTITVGDIKETVPMVSGAKRYYLQRFVIPQDKALVDPAWKNKQAFSEEELGAIWEQIKSAFPAGGVR